MATYHAISAVGQGITSLLRSARPPDLQTTDVRLFHQRDFAKGLEEGISVYLYRVTVSGARRNLPSTLSPTGRPQRRPLPLDLYFLVTPWARTAELQHVLLGFAMRAIEDAPSLPAPLLNAHVPGAFRPDEAVELIADTLSVQDNSYVWEVAKASMQVSAAYVARVVPIDSQVELPTEGGLVQTRSYPVAPEPSGGGQ